MLSQLSYRPTRVRYLQGRGEKIHLGRANCFAGYAVLLGGFCALSIFLLHIIEHQFYLLACSPWERDSIIMPRLPEKQQKILDFICDQHAQTGVFPSVREIAAHMDFKSTNTVDYHLRRMEASGVLERGARRARSFAALAAPGRAKAGRSPGGASTGGNGRRMEIPLLGRVAAGEPILAEQHFEDAVSLSSLFHCDDQTFALQVRGESMINAGIMEGDLVIVKHQATVANGEIGVAVIDGEATVKRIYDEGKNWRLQPENDSLEPIIVAKGLADFSIAGKVVGVIRQI